jgi:outer membrane protein, heavy metal efflux system
MTFRYWYCLAAFAVPAGAQSLASLVEEALRNNREILAAQKKYESARQRSPVASSLPDPTLSLGYASNGGPWPGAGLGRDATSNIGFAVSQQVPFPGKRKLRGEIAQKEADAEFEAYRSVRLSVTARLKQAYHELHHAEEAIASTEESQELLRTILRISESRYAVGGGTQQEIFKAQTQFSIFEAQLLRYQQERVSKEIEINALLNRPPGTHLELEKEMAVGDFTVSLDELVTHGRTAAPALAREQKMVERSELSANLARKGYYPDYTVSGGYFNQGGMPPMWQFRVDVQIPAYYWRKQRVEVAGETFALMDARHSYEAADVGIQARIREDYTVAATARKLIDLYDKSVVPEARLALESSLAGYQTGRADFLSVFANFMNVVDNELMYHEEIMTYHVALARLEEATGMELDR